MDTKFCGACQTELEISSFGKNSSKPNGLQSQCKVCRSAKQKASESYREYQRNRRRVRDEAEKERDRKRSRDRYLANPEEVKQRSKEWRKRNPERKKENDRNWRQRNTARANDNAKRWVTNNPEKRREIVRRYDSLHKEENRIRQARRRAAIQANGFIPYTREQLLGKLLVWRYCCYLCKQPLDDTLHWDHVKPIVAGGADMLCNLRPAHSRCNQIKSGKWPLGME
jgi:hypothetical protein